MQRLRLGDGRRGLEARQRRLRASVIRTNDALQPGATRAFRDAENAADTPQPPVQCKLPARRMFGQPLARDLSGGREQRERDRQVEARSLFLQVGRCEVDGRLVARPLQLSRLDSAPNALLSLLARAVDEPDERE